MKLTNNSNLPAALVRALENDPYTNDGSDYTPSTLNKPFQIKALEDRHAHEIEEDAEDGLYRLYGQVSHGILERANMADLAEKRFFSTFTVNGKDFKVSAQIDTLSLTDGVLSDFKMTTAWSFKRDSKPKADWISQMNTQLELMRRNGYDAIKLQIIGLIRDWQIKDARINANYPLTPIAVREIPMWSRQQSTAWIEMRIAGHEAAKLTPSELLPECTDDDRYAGKESWAVVKRGKTGKTRAITGGVQYSMEAAEKLCAQTPGTFVEYRREDPTKRCEFYCKVKNFCHQYKRLTASDKQADTNEEQVG